MKCIHEAYEGEVGIGAGLARALIAFRLPDQTRRIWVDAICINQNDLTERQSQVRLMGALYGKAEHVLCWLGPFNDPVYGESRARLARGSVHQFVQDMTRTSMCRKVFRTAKGHVGLGHRTMKRGDVCAVLPGAVFPLVLRQCNKHFQLVGPALIYGFMNGEVGGLQRDGLLLD